MKKILYPMLAQDGTEVTFINGEVQIDCKMLGNPEYILEKKYDGSRYILQWTDSGKAYLTSRNISVKDDLPTDKTENLRGYLFDDSLEMAGTVIDGEVLVKINGEFPFGNGSSEVNKVMLASPDKCKSRLQEPNIELVYVIYDCLFYKGLDLRGQPLHIRKNYLEAAHALIGLHQSWFSGKYLPSAYMHTHSVKDVEFILSLGFEGAMLKKLDSLYEEGNHSKNWIKIKKQITADGVIMGYQKGTGKYSKTVGALIIGQYFLEEITITSSGAEPKLVLREVCTLSGMTDEFRDNFRDRILSLPHEHISDGKRVLLTIPEKEMDVIEFVAQEKTKSKYRHPRFIQCREDKPVKDCIF